MPADGTRMTSPRPLERRQLTVMLCDLVGWSALSVQRDAEDLADVMQAYRGRCAAVIARHGGMVAQYVGDGILAYFGYPRAHEDDAERAIRAALEIAEAEQSPRVHIGIATGTVVVGHLSDAMTAPSDAASRQSWDEISAVGSAPNLASRLQGLADPGAVIVSEETRHLCGAMFEYHDLGHHALKGFGDSIQAWQVLREPAVRSRFHALRAPTLTPLVDRRAEVEQLRDLWERTKQGRGGAVLLTGEAGTGKSRLAEVVASEIAVRPSVRIWFYCSPNRQSTPLAPIVRQIFAGTGIAATDDDATKLEKLRRIVPIELGASNEAVPLLAHLLSIRYEHAYPSLNMSPQRLRRRLFDALMQLLEAHATRAPLLLVVEDLHWLDPSSYEFMGMLLDRVERLHMLVVLTARPEFQAHWDDHPALVHLPLGPLERGDAIAMIKILCGDTAIPPRTVDHIADKTDGLPLFIEDLTRDVLETVEASGEPNAALASSIPATLNDSLMSRLDRLGSAKSVAQTAAVIGREFAYELLARVAELPDDELTDAVDRLVAARLLVRRRAAQVLTYAFQHALVRDAAYSSLLRKAQEALHAKVARVMTQDFPDIAELQPELVAHHLQAARDPDRAADYLVKAAKLSARRSGFVEAIAQLQGALKLLAGRDPSPERMRRELRIHLALGGVYAEYRGFSSQACGDAYRRALELCRQLGDAPEVFAVLSGLGSFEITRANFAACRALGAECLERAAKQTSRPPFIMGHLLLGGTAFLTAQFADARRHLDAALADYDADRKTGRRAQVLYVQDQKSTALCYLGLIDTIMGDVAEGRRAAERGLEHSRTLGGPHTINFSQTYLAAVLHIAGDYDEALQRADEALELAREQGFATWIGVSQIIRGYALVHAGQAAEGLGEIVAGMKAHSEMDALAYRAFGLALFAGASMFAGAADDAERALDEALTLVSRTGENFYLAELWRLRGELLATRNDAPAAEAALRRAIDVAREQGAELFEERSTASLKALQRKKPVDSR